MLFHFIHGNADERDFETHGAITMHRLINTRVSISHNNKATTYNQHIDILRDAQRYF